MIQDAAYNTYDTSGYLYWAPPNSTITRVSFSYEVNAAANTIYLGMDFNDKADYWKLDTTSSTSGTADILLPGATYVSFGIYAKAPFTGNSNWYVRIYNLRIYYSQPSSITAGERDASSDGKHTTVTYYDGMARVAESKSEFDATQYSTVANTYDNRGQKASQTVPFLNAGSAYATPPAGQAVTRYAYDTLNRTTVITNTDGTTKRSFHAGWTTTAVDENGHQKVQTADAFGRLARVDEYTGTYPNAALYATTNYSYDVNNNLTRVTDAAGNISTMTYDWLGRKTAMSDADMYNWAYQYDAAGNMISQTDARGNTISFQYDELNRLRMTTYPSPKPTRTNTYDDTSNGNKGIGRRTGMADESGATGYKYDARGRLTAEVKTIAGSGTYTTSYSYDSLDRLVTTTYPDGEAVTNTYNAATYLQQVSGTATYASGITYNASGQPTGQNAGNGLSTAYGYDNRQRLASINTGSGGIQNLAYSYDGVGNVTAVNDALRSEIVGFTLDALDRLETTGSPIPDSHTYSTTGNLTSKGGASYTYNASILQHDDFSQGTGNWQPISGAWTIETTGSGPVYGNNNPTGLWNTSVTGSSTWDNYSAQIEVKEVGASGGGMAILFRVQDDPTYYYQFNLQFGRARLYKREGSTWTWLNETVYSWNADTWYALTVVVNGNQIDAYVNGQYQFTTYDSTFRKGRVGVDSWNGHHQFRQLFAGRLSPRAHAVSQVGSTSFEYDPNGNLVYDGTRRFTYDADNHLTQVVSGTTPVTTTFVYDGDGRMVVRAVQDGATTTDTYYVGQHYEVQVVGGNQTVTKYYYANGKRIAFRRDGAVYYVHSDHLGSANKITDSSGAVKSSYLYYPWGGARERSEQVAYDYRYNGQRAIDSAGMYYYSDGKSYGRFYEPALARWTQPDSVMPKPEDPQTWANSQNWNRYSYVSNNPLTRTDPSGHCDPNDFFCLAGLLLESFSHPELRDRFAQESQKAPQQAILETPGVEGLLQRLGLSTEQIAAIKADPALAAAFETLPMAGMEGAPALGKAKMLEPAIEGFGSFEAFKRVFGAAGKGFEWHHIVEQNPDNISRLGQEALQSPENLIKLPEATHHAITGFYNSKQQFTGGLTVRQWLSTKSIQEQYEFGIQQLKKWGVLK